METILFVFIILGLPILFILCFLIYLLNFYLNISIKNKIMNRIKQIKIKKLGYILIILGVFLPLLLLMFFGDDWYPAKQSGIIYSILNSKIVFVEEEKHPIKFYGKTKVDLSYLDVDEVSISFRYLAGSGLIFILIGSAILIKELEL